MTIFKSKVLFPQLLFVSLYNVLLFVLFKGFYLFLFVGFIYVKHFFLFTSENIHSFKFIHTQYIYNLLNLVFCVSLWVSSFYEFCFLHEGFCFPASAVIPESRNNL